MICEKSIFKILLVGNKIVFPKFVKFEQLSFFKQKIVPKSRDTIFKHLHHFKHKSALKSIGYYIELLSFPLRI